MKYKLKRMTTATLILALGGASRPPINVHANTFNDTNYHWTNSHIQSMAQEGLINGRGDSVFDPDEHINRAEIFTLVNNMFGFTDEANIHFEDVSAEAWYAQHVRRAVAAGYIQGFGDNTARPTNNITRAEVSVILNNILEFPTTAMSSFADSHLIPSWAYGAVNAIAQAGLVRGFPDGTFRATNNITRAEATVVLSLVRDLLTNYDTLLEEAPKEETAAIEENLEIIGSFGTEELQVVNGNVIIAGNEASFVENLQVNGDLKIQASLGDNLVFLNNVTVTGAVRIHGTNVHLLGEFNDVYMNGENTRLRLRNSGETTVENLNVLGNATNSRISPDRNTRIENADINARVAINGTGRIGTANIRVSGVTVTNHAIIENLALDSQPVSRPTVATGGSGGGGGWSGGGQGGDQTQDPPISEIPNQPPSTGETANPEPIDITDNVVVQMEL